MRSLLGEMCWDSTRPVSRSGFALSWKWNNWLEYPEFSLSRRMGCWCPGAGSGGCGASVRRGRGWFQPVPAGSSGSTAGHSPAPQPCWQHLRGSGFKKWQNAASNEDWGEKREGKSVRSSPESPEGRGGAAAQAHGRHWPAYQKVFLWHCGKELSVGRLHRPDTTGKRRHFYVCGV